MFRVETPKQAAKVISENLPPFEIEIPRQARVSQFMAKIRFYLIPYGLTVGMSNSSTEENQLIYIHQKG